MKFLAIRFAFFCELLSLMAFATFWSCPRVILSCGLSSSLKTVWDDSKEAFLVCAVVWCGVLNHWLCLPLTLMFLFLLGGRLLMYLWNFIRPSFSFSSVIYYWDRHIYIRLRTCAHLSFLTWFDSSFDLFSFWRDSFGRNSLKNNR
jgi:hypothetical protein